MLQHICIHTILQCVYIYIYMYVCIYIYIYIYIYIHDILVYLYVYIYIYMIFVCIYIYIYTCTHIYIYIYIHLYIAVVVTIIIPSRRSRRHQDADSRTVPSTAVTLPAVDASQLSLLGVNPYISCALLHCHLLIIGSGFLATVIFRGLLNITNATTTLPSTSLPQPLLRPPQPTLPLLAFRHRLNGYLAQRVPRLFLASSSKMCLNCEVQGRYPLSQVPIKPVPIIIILLYYCYYITLYYFVS